VFTPDAHIDYESAGGIKGDLETVANWLETTMAGFPMTQHLIANIDVKLGGDTATVRAMFTTDGHAERQELPVAAGTTTISCTADGWRSRKL
jgi:hypothetical protein